MHISGTYKYAYDQEGVLPCVFVSFADKSNGLISVKQMMLFESAKKDPGELEIDGGGYDWPGGHRSPLLRVLTRG